MKTNFQSMMDRVTKCNDAPSLLKLDKSATRLYGAGFFTEKEYIKIDVAIMEKIAKLEN